jgi:hypothetical protein
MEAIFDLLMFAVLTSIHIGGLWITYKKTGDNRIGAGVRGAVAVVVAFYFCVVLISLIIPHYWILVHFYLIPFEVIGGFVFALLYWCLIDKFELRQVNVFVKAIIGLFIGAFIGLAFGLLSTNGVHRFISYEIFQPTWEHETKGTIFIVLLKIIFFSFISMISAVVADNKKFK